MERIKDFLKNAFSYPGMLLASHRITAISMIAATIMFALYNIMTSVRRHMGAVSDYAPFELFFHISLAVLFFAVFSLCLESIRIRWKNNGVKIAVFSFFALLSILMSFIIADFFDGSHLRIFTTLISLRDRLGYFTVFMYIAGLLSLAVLVAIYCSYERSVDQPFNAHFININSNLFFTSIIYSVIQVGVLFLTLIVTLLLYDDAFEFMMPILILINGLFYAPAVVCAITRANEKANLFFQILVRYVMLTIVILAYLIIYIYMIKLVITTSVPSNSVYAILTALFIISMLITYMCTSFEDTGILQKFAYNSPLIFAPFILMQCYTVIVRIGQYGLTPKRYAGIAFILFEIVYIIYYTVKRRLDKEIAGSGVILILCAFILIVVFVPGINAKSLSVSTAKRTLSSYIRNTEAGIVISDKEIIRANAAYGFLKDGEFGKDRLAKYFPSFDENSVKELREKAKLASAKANKSDREGEIFSVPDQNGWYYADLMELSGGDYLDLEGYKKLMHVRIEDRRQDPDITCDTSNLPVYIYKDDYNDRTPADPANVDLSDFCKKFNELAYDMNEGFINNDEFRRQCADICVIDINENARLYITDADISRSSDKETRHVNLEGYLLIK